MDTVIKIENLYKEYKLGVISRGTLYRDLQSWWAKIRKKEDPNSIIGHNFAHLNSKSNILALDNINLDISKGEVIGIIGSNGAGKSTLLKIISRITTPTKGNIKIKGRTASLLEVGTGFHGELTGKENIYLNGTINGLTKIEIGKVFDKIVSFAAIEQFVDTPVKRYSSGMFVRLGFAVAAHLDPDILIVDEVLAVGDHNFQKKAMNKMNSVSQNDGKTILFVSHNMESIKKLCTKVVIMYQGKILDIGKTDEMISRYVGGKVDITKQFNKIKWEKNEHGPGGNIVKLKSLCTKNIKGEIISEFFINEDVIVEAEFWVLELGHQISLSFQFYDSLSMLFQTFDNYLKEGWGKQKSFDKGLYKTICKIPKNLLNQGTLDINVIIFLPPGDIEDSYQVMHPKRASGALSFKIKESYDFDSVRGTYPYDWHKDIKIRPHTICETSKIE